MTDRVSLPRAELVWPTVPRGHADEPALDVLAADPRRARQGEPAVPRPDVRPAARRRGVGRSTRPAPCRATFSVDDHRPARPVARRAGQDRRRRDRAAQGRRADRGRGRKAQNAAESRLDRRPPVGPAPRPTSSTATTSSSATRWPTRTRCAELFAVTAGRRQAGGQQVPDRRPGPARRRSPARTTPRRPRSTVDRSKQAPLASPPARRGQGHVRPLGDARGRPDARSSPRRRSCRRRLSNGLEVLVAERHELPIVTLEPGRQGGRDARPGRQGGAGRR